MEEEEVDTAIGSWSKIICDDCEQPGGVIFRHWGPMVPKGRVGYFCGGCMYAREEYLKTNGTAKPMSDPPEAAMSTD